MVSASPDFDAVVIGAGFSGMYMLKALRDRLGLKVRVYEAGETVGGTWYWNRYPGARCDSEAYVYCFTWDKELLQEWEWSERYPEQPEILRYLEHVAARHDLKRDICFNTRVTGAQFDEVSGRWNVRTDTPAASEQPLPAKSLIDFLTAPAAPRSTSQMEWTRPGRATRSRPARACVGFCRGCPRARARRNASLGGGNT